MKLIGKGFFNKMNKDILFNSICFVCKDNETIYKVYGNIKQYDSSDARYTLCDGWTSLYLTDYQRVHIVRYDAIENVRGFRYNIIYVQEGLMSNTLECQLYPHMSQPYLGEIRCDLTPIMEFSV